MSKFFKKRTRAFGLMIELLMIFSILFTVTIVVIKVFKPKIMKYITDMRAQEDVNSQENDKFLKEQEQEKK